MNVARIGVLLAGLVYWAFSVAVLSFGVYGNERGLTPNIDAFAEGVRPKGNISEVKLLDHLIGLTDEEWALIGPLLPAEHGRGCRPAQDNRRYFEGMMWLARTGAQWRHLPDDYGKWNSVFRRYRRWLEVGVFDAMLESLAEMVERDPSADMIDSTIVRAHHCAVGIKRGLSKQRRLVDRVAALPPNSMPAAMPKAARSASS